jgi:hypothetical protein
MNDERALQFEIIAGDVSDLVTGLERNRDSIRASKSGRSKIFIVCAI